MDHPTFFHFLFVHNKGDEMKKSYFYVVQAFLLLGACFGMKKVAGIHLTDTRKANGTRFFTPCDFRDSVT
jgi:hypothetical protein